MRTIKAFIRAFRYAVVMRLAEAAHRRFTAARYAWVVGVSVYRNEMRPDASRDPDDPYSILPF
jgi:hypothetical protein